MEPSIAEEEESPSPATSEIALYVGLSLAVVVFLVVVLVALSLLRRRRLPSGYRLTQSGALKLLVILVLDLLKLTIYNDFKLVEGSSKDFQSIPRDISHSSLLSSLMSFCCFYCRIKNYNFLVKDRGRGPRGWKKPYVSPPLYLPFDFLKYVSYDHETYFFGKTYAFPTPWQLISC